jgi:glyoxylase-like metal-dependent hydrolase (beta-lactamase superfamily II)
MKCKHWLAAAVVAAGFWTTISSAQRAPASPRIYIFDGGAIRGLDPALFNFRRDELEEVDFVNTSYLIVHPRGTLMFDAGAVADSHFKGDGTPVVEGVVTATQPLMPQLAAAGYTPRDITYFALSHYHSDHTGNANEFCRRPSATTCSRTARKGSSSRRLTRRCAMPTRSSWTTKTSTCSATAPWW